MISGRITEHEILAMNPERRVIAPFGDINADGLREL